MYVPLREGATAKSVSAEEVMNTKLLVTGERHRIAADLEKRHGKSFLHLYAGSVAMASLQTAYGICDTHPYRIWRDFNKKIQLLEAMHCIPLSYGGIKHLLPATLLKFKLNGLLYLMLRTAKKLKISSNEWS